METYKVVALSTSHLSPDDRDELQEMANTPAEGMVMARDTGFFVKLYDDLENSRNIASHLTLRYVIEWAHKQGFRMIEFDRDAELVEDLKRYYW